MQQSNVFSAIADACKPGGGKTLSIIAQAALNHISGNPSIIAVPSIDLQSEYVSRFVKAGLFEPADIQVINSERLDSHESVSNTFFKSLTSNKTIIITHEALKLMDHKSRNATHYAKRDLLIDEAFNPIWSAEVSIKRLDDGDVNILNTNWKSWLNPDSASVKGFLRLRPRKTQYYCDFLNMTTVRSIENTNYKVYISESNWKSLDANDAYKINFFGVFDINILARFRSVSISSAAFDTTILGMLLRKSKVNLKVVRGYEKQDEHVIFHVAKLDNELYSHSKSSVVREKDRTARFRNYVAETLNGRESLILRNVVDSGTLPYGNYHTISNNCHGINTYRHIDAISIESVYNSSNHLTGFMQFVLDFTIEEIILGMEANTFYQCIMRTAARVENCDKSIDVFLLDGKILPYLTKYYFSNYDVKYIDLGESKKKSLSSVDVNTNCMVKEFISRMSPADYQSNLLYQEFVSQNDINISNRKFSKILVDLGITKKHTERGTVFRIENTVESV